VQDDIAERVLPMLRGAMAELSLGDPRVSRPTSVRSSTRRRAARSPPTSRSAGTKARPSRRCRFPRRAITARSSRPTLIEIADPRTLTREVFGPVLHVVRYPRGRARRAGRRDQRDRATASRTASTAASTRRWTSSRGRIRAGNVYVNRNIIGAVVGVQPFGGEGLSGTGPKAGGPLYCGGSCASRARDARSASQALAGPTGRTNVLRSHPRGRVACIAADAAGARGAGGASRRRSATLAVDSSNRGPMPCCSPVRAKHAARLRSELARGTGRSFRDRARDGGRTTRRVSSRNARSRINTTASGGNALVAVARGKRARMSAATSHEEARRNRPFASSPSCRADGRLSNVALARAVGPVAHAVRRARARPGDAPASSGDYATELDAAQLGMGLTVFIEVAIDRTSQDAFDAFRDAVLAIPQVQECHMVAGGSTTSSRCACRTWPPTARS
jgi:hypothetical protein